MTSRAERIALAWSLIDAAGPVLAPRTRTWLCVTIGAGDHDDAINRLLPILADRPFALPEHLWEPLWHWVRGYAGGDTDEIVRALLMRLRIPEPARPPVAQPPVERVPYAGRGRRLRCGVTRAGTGSVGFPYAAAPQSPRRSA
jgi:hypothetical protein